MPFSWRLYKEVTARVALYLVFILIELKWFFQEHRHHAHVVVEYQDGSTYLLFVSGAFYKRDPGRALMWTSNGHCR